MDELIRVGDEYVLDDYWHLKVQLDDDEGLDEKAELHQIDFKPNSPAATGQSPGQVTPTVIEISDEFVDKKEGENSPHPPTIQELQRQHLHFKAEFEASDEWKSLSAHLRMKRRKGLKISQIVGLGLGSCENNTYGSVDSRSLQKETALLSTLMTFFGIKTCVSQDPIFEPLDKTFLKSLGYKVVDDPRAFELIDGETLVWADHSHGNVFDSIAKGMHPALLICRDLSSVHTTFHCEPCHTEAQILKSLLEWKEYCRGNQGAKMRREMIRRYETWSWVGKVFGDYSDLVVYSKAVVMNR